MKELAYPWIDRMDRYPLPLHESRLTFVFVSSYDKADDFREYKVIYYSPRDMKWYVTGDDEDKEISCISFDYWMYAENPLIQIENK